MESVKSIYDLTAISARDFIDLAVGSIMLSAGKRADDVYELMSNEYQVLAADPIVPRRHRWVQLTSKQDPEGKGPESDRTTVVFCICLELLDEDDKEAFICKLKMDPFCLCAKPCPFQHIANYSSLIPDCFGIERDAAIKLALSSGKQMYTTKSSLDPLHFVRALTARGKGGEQFRVLTTNTLGKLF